MNKKYFLKKYLINNRIKDFIHNVIQFHSTQSLFERTLNIMLLKKMASTDILATCKKAWCPQKKERR